jgi:Tol biopolymer transport system component
MIFQILLFTILLFALNCTLFQKSIKIKPLNFQYNVITNYYFNSNSDKPFPLTVQKGTNLNPSTTKDGRFLFFATDKEGNYDIWFRDLTTSIVLPVTTHPASEYKPAISPDGKLLAYVSEEFDSEGDIVLLEVEPEKWIQAHLKGQEISKEDPIFITNQDRKKNFNSDRYKDTDPTFAPNGKYLVFASERFSVGILNLVLYEISSGKMFPLTKQGGTSPHFISETSVVYLSFKDEPNGEIYSLNILTGEEKRLTQDKYMDFSPSMDEKNRFLFYTSIRKDTNQNGVLDLKDASVIVKKDLETGKEIYLTPTNASVFDSKYSSFNGGTVLYSQAIYNAINVYFVPAYGSIPKQPTIRDQYEKVKLLSGRVSRDWYLLALDSIRAFFEEDPKYFIFKTKVLDSNLEDLYNRKRTEELNSLLNSENLKLHQIEGDFYHKAILLKWESKLQKVSVLSKYLKLEKELMEKYPEYKEDLSAIQELIAEELEQKKSLPEALSKYVYILKSNPSFYNRDKIVRKIAEISYINQTSEIPQEIISLLEDPNAILEDKRDLLNFLEKKIIENSSTTQIKNKLKELRQKSKDKSSILTDLLDYIYASALHEEKKFKESNQILDSFLKPLPPRDDLCWSREDCVPVQICKNDPTCLKAHLLKSKNFEGLGSINDSLSELRVFLENYDPRLGVEMDKAEMEKSFRYFENRARELYNEGSLKDSATNYFYNTENMFHLKNKNLHTETLYKKYAVYYYKKMIDTSLELAKRQAEQARASLLNQLNILGKDKLDVFGKLNSALKILLDNKLAKNLKFFGDLRDLESEIVLGDPSNKDDAIRLMNMHFNLARPRARPSLYLAALYGYAYYLINRAVITEEFYRKNQTMTVARKEKVLEDFKAAEYELKWIIFADPQYSDAYQLLGWLYQYIDISKSLKSQEEVLTEGEIFRDSFNKFFPSKYIEENIDLYEQILTFLGDIPNKKVLSDLNLNLGNNYLLLNNYPKANQHFSEVYKYKTYINLEVQFENSTQYSLFEYNFARTLIYLGKFEEAVVHLKNALEIIEKNEYVRKEAYAKKFLESEQKYSPQYKMILLNALIGLSYMEAGNYKSAIFHIKRTIALNKDFPFLDLTHLYNALAICYLRIEDTRLALFFVKNAKLSYFQTKSSFQFPSFGAWFWNLILPENIRIIGDGRFPGAFPKEYSYLLSLGIEAGIYEKQNNLKKLQEVYELREKFIKQEGLQKTTVARLIAIFDQNTKAYLEFERGNYINSFQIYKKIYQASSSLPLKWTYLRRAENAFLWNEKANEPKFVLQELNELLEFKSNSIKTCLPDEKEENILQIQKENCEREFEANYIWYNPTLATLFVKLANTYKSKNPSLYSYYLAIALDKVRQAGSIPQDLEFLQKDPFTRFERLDLKLLEAKILLSLSEEERFLKLIKEILSYTGQFRAYKKEYLAKVLEGEFLTKKAKSRREFINLFSFHETNLEKFFSDPYLIYSLPLEIIDYQFKQVEYTYAKLELYENILFLKERYQSVILFKNIIKNLINFEDEKLQKDFFSLKTEILEYFKLNKFLEGEIEKRNPIFLLWQKRNEKLKIVNAKIQEFKKNHPRRASFLEWRKNETKLVSQSPLPVFRLLKTVLGELILWKYNEKKVSQFKAKQIKEIFLLEKVWDLPVHTEIQVIIDPEIEEEEAKEFVENLSSKFLVQVAYRSSQVLSKPRFEQLSLENISYLAKQEELKDSNLAETESLRLHIYNTDVLVGEVLETSNTNIFGETAPLKINLKEIFQKEHNISTVVIGSTSFKTEWFLTEILQTSGIPVVIFTPSLKELENFKSRESLIQLTNNAQTRTVGQFLLWKKSGNYSKEKFEFHLRRALEFEHIGEYERGIEEINLANAAKELGTVDLESVKSDFIDARLKAKLYKTGNKFFFFEKILEKYSSNLEYSLLILENLVKFCYTYYELQDCNKFYNQYSQLALNSKLDLKLRKDSFLKIKYFRYLTLGKYKKVQVNFFWNLEPSQFEDEFLFYKDLVFLLKKHFLLEEANAFCLQLRSIAKSKEEKKVVEEIFRDTQILIHISGFGPKRDFQFSDDIYSGVLSKNWKIFDQRLSEIRQKAQEDMLEAYREKLYITWKKLETGEDYDPKFLNPEKTILGYNYFSLLDDKDRILVAYILLKSTINQVSNEINFLLEELIHPSNKTNFNLAAYILLSYIESLLNRADIVSLEKYFQLFEERFLQQLSNKNLINRYLFAKYKFILFQDKKPEQIEEVKTHDYYSFYEKALKSSSKDSLVILRELLNSKFKQKFDSRNKRELLDFIYFLQRKAFHEENEEVFMDLVYFKDKISSINERFFERSFYMNEIGEPLELSKQIYNLLPKGQEYKMVANLGFETFVMTLISGREITGDKIIDDNRIWRYKIYDYYRHVRESGFATLQKEELELSFRSMLGLEKNKITYLYLSGYWIKVPLEMKETDRFFLVQSPEFLITNKPVKESNLLSGDFFLKKYTYSLPSSYKYYENLIHLEIKQGGKNLLSKANISFEPIVFQDLEQILFGSIPLSKTDNYPKREGVWIIFHSGLYETSFYKDDINFTLHLLDKFHTGVGVFSLGLQIGQPSNLLFVKEFLKKTDYSLNLHSRFATALRRVRLEYPRENYWNGYRLYTNCFIVLD